MAAKKAAKDAQKAALAASGAEGAAQVAEIEKGCAATGGEGPQARQLQPAACQDRLQGGQEVSIPPRRVVLAFAGCLFEDERERSISRTRRRRRSVLPALSVPRKGGRLGLGLKLELALFGDGVVARA